MIRMFKETIAQVVSKAQESMRVQMNKLLQSELKNMVGDREKKGQ